METKYLITMLRLNYSHINIELNPVARLTSLKSLFCAKILDCSSWNQLFFSSGEGAKKWYSFLGVPRMNPLSGSLICPVREPASVIQACAKRTRSFSLKVLRFRLVGWTKKIALVVNISMVQQNTASISSIALKLIIYAAYLCYK